MIYVCVIVICTFVVFSFSNIENDFGNLLIFFSILNYYLPTRSTHAIMQPSAV